VKLRYFTDDYLNEPMKVVVLFFLGMMALSAEAQYQFIAPMPNSPNQNPERCIVVREGHPLDTGIAHQKNLFSIQGSTSGDHEFTIELSNDLKTVILKPVIPFQFSETVTVSIFKLKRADGFLVPSFTFSFSTRREFDASTLEAIHAAIQKMNEDETTNNEAVTQNELSGAPIINVTTNTHPNPGDVFYDYQVGLPVTGTKLTACYMVQSDGDSVFSHHGHGVIADFEINHNGYLTFMDENSAGYKMYDSSYHYMRSFSVVNGYTTDVHELQIFPDGHYFLLGDDYEMVDMKPYGYNFPALVAGSVIQEFDAGDH
jgi:hypothetical protein